MRVEIEEITPEKAEQLLRLNRNNRPVRSRHVAILAREMKEGRWKTNGDSIRVSDDLLIDGQHRLMAVIESGCSITSVVAYVEADVFDSIDVGQRRSNADVLAIRGEVCTHTLAAALKKIDLYMTGRGWATYVRYTNTQIEELLEKYPTARISVARTNSNRNLLPRSIMAACHFLFAANDEMEADKFFVDLVSGQGLSEGDGVYVLREKLVRNLTEKAKLSPEYLMALTIKAWNARRENKKIRILKIGQEGDRIEPYPLVK